MASLSALLLPLLNFILIRDDLGLSRNVRGLSVGLIYRNGESFLRFSAYRHWRLFVLMEL